MAFVHGKNATLSIDGSAITSYTDTVSLSRDVDTAETTVFGDDDKTYIAGLNGATITCSGPWDVTLDGVMSGVQDGATVAFAYSPDSGTTTYSGNCFLTNYSPGGGVSGRDNWSASFIITGAVARA